MLPFKTIIQLDPNSRSPLYLQISNEMIKQIAAGIIPVGLKLPGGRKMAELLLVSRRTVILAYEELDAQGWIEIKPQRGTFISSKIPVIKKRTFSDIVSKNGKAKSCFPMNQKLDFLTHYSPPDLSKIQYIFDTGYPDVRLAPVKELGQNLSRVLNSKRHSKILNYAADFIGNLQLREELVKYLAETRGIKISLENLMITRGSLMAFSGIFQILLEMDDAVVMGDVSFKVAKDIAKISGGKILTVPVDENGMDVNSLEKICKKQSIRAVFVMPHHHHPTTVSLSAERRIKLLMLAEKYRFAIIEDDYDYDFHYARSPILPMASADQNGAVIYVGSLSKIVAPGLRLGFIVAPENFIREFSRLSRFMDCHGNPAMEKAIALLFKEGIIRRHLKKSLKIYRERRDLFCELLQSELGEFVKFKIPEGGLAVWVNFDEKIDLSELREQAMKKGVMISKTVFQNSKGKNLNAIRMGLASLNEEEMKNGIEILKQLLQNQS